MPYRQRPIINMIFSELNYSILSRSVYWEILNSFGHSRTRDIKNLGRKEPWRNTIHANTMWNQSNLLLPPIEELDYRKDGGEVMNGPAVNQAQGEIYALETW